MAQTVPDPLVSESGIPDPLLPPGGDNTGQIGTDAVRWAEIRGVEVEAGDLSLRSLDGSKHWKLVEGDETIEAYNVKTGQRFALAMIPMESP